MEFAFTILSYLCSLLYFLPLIFVAGILYDFVRYKTLSSASLLKKHVVVGINIYTVLSDSRVKYQQTSQKAKGTIVEPFNESISLLYSSEAGC